MPKVTLYWDFFGPRALPTAEHHARHLRQFLLDGAVEAEVRVEPDEGGGAVSALCAFPAETPAEVVETVRLRLRPRRQSGDD